LEKYIVKILHTVNGKDNIYLERFMGGLPDDSVGQNINTYHHTHFICKTLTSLLVLLESFRFYGYSLEYSLVYHIQKLSH